MNVGLLFDLRNPPGWHRPWGQHYAEMLDLVEEAERLGIDAVWTTEHHLFEDGYLTQPLVALAAMAARTRRIRLGTGIVIAALRHPRHVAEEAALVDLISNGRLELGIGAGYRTVEYEAFSADISRRMTSTDQATAEIRDLLWGGGMLPPPVQPQVPIWLGYQGPRGAHSAGRLGCGLLSLNPGLLDPYLAGLEAGGHDQSGARMGGLVNLIVADDPEATAARLVPHYAHQLQTYATARVDDRPGPTAEDLAPQELIRRMTRSSSPADLAVRTPDEAVELIAARTAAIPATHVYLWASLSGMPDDIAQRHVHLTCTHLRPRLTQSGNRTTGPVSSSGGGEPTEH